MATARIKRLQREVMDVAKDTQSGIIVKSIGDSDSLDHLIGSFPGPSETSYQGGRFEVDILVPDRYPFAPLKMKFITKVYHPNISSATGFICLDLLGAGWSPVLTIRTALVSLQSLLSSPEPSDPQDAEVAKHYLSDKKSFEATAKAWTEAYAKDKSKSDPNVPMSAIELAGLDEVSVAKFVGMGFDSDLVINVLKSLNYRGNNVTSVSDDQVVEKLCS